MLAAVTFAVDHLLIRQYSLTVVAPVDRGFFAIGESLLVEVEEPPLCPAVVVGVAGGDLARPVVAKAETFNLTGEVGDVCVGGLVGVDACLDRVVLRGQTEGIPAHGVEDLLAVHARLATDDVGRGVALGVSDVETCTTGIRKHIQHVVFFFFGILLCFKEFFLSPVFLPLGFDLLVLVLHKSARIMMLIYHSLPEIRTLGIVLKHSNYAEADRILRVFTADFGLISAIARGVRQLKSRKAASLESFRVSELRLYRRTGELFLITGSSLRQDFEVAELPRLAAAYSMAEWLLTLLPAEKPVPEVYALLTETLKDLASSPKYTLIQLAFQTQLLDLLGYLPEYTADTPEEKLLRFLRAAELSTILRLAEDAGVFARAAVLLEKIYSSLHEKSSKVAQATREW